jgi:Radical SAM superfamily
MLTVPQLTKLRLMTEGVFITPAAAHILSLYEANRPLTLADYATTSGVTLQLDADIWVNAPILAHNPNFVSSTPAFTLDAEDHSRLVVRDQEVVLSAKPLPVPDYYNERNSSEEYYTSYAITHADRVRISPLEGCGMVCTFCDVPYKAKYRRRRIDGLIDAIKRALADTALPARHVLISGGTPRAEDNDFLKMVYLTVATTFPELEVDIMMVPTPGLLDLPALYGSGIHGLALNLEIFNPEIAKRVMRGKYDLGLPYLLSFIERAAAHFGPGRVRSLLVAGLEPLEDTLKGVEELAKRGCDPVLSPFRPDPATPLRNQPVPSTEFLTRLYLESLEIVARYNVKLGPRCIPCQHNTLTFPDGSGAYYYQQGDPSNRGSAHAS